MCNKVTNQQFINGRNVKDMSKADCIATIRAAEADIATLDAIETDSKAVDNEVKTLQGFIADVVKVLDAKK